ncbi:helix-turn-helix transcriptional regulator [Rhodococcus erythropolis]|uniref:helix-turn-helix domain-containing protein n=1 Tax=Rhodococcus erythropolis TaxID=1833 RepID=UPI0029493033|nr:helix-turn-helix transcriptional regulator [Rhodococcus erythropolis]MDV6274115.1 helix-turn-helix transcriptional regulator [Rhodococcus erythropolis]
MTTWFESNPKSEAMLAEERLILSTTELVHNAMERRNMSQAELAQRLGVDPDLLRRQLAGECDMTVRSLAAMLHQLNAAMNLDDAFAQYADESLLLARVFTDAGVRHDLDDVLTELGVDE